MTAGEKCENAVVELLGESSLTTVSNFYAAHANATAIADENTETTLQKPCVVVEWNTREEMAPQTGNLIGDLIVSVRAIAADTTRTVFSAMKEEVFAAIYRDDLPTLLNATDVTNFNVFGFAGELRTNQEISGGTWEASISIPLCICNKDIAAS